MRAMIADGVKVQTIVTSPPYWGGLRDYGHEAQLGLERDPAEYVRVLVETFRLARDLLAEDGTFWLNVGDVYAASGKGGGGNRGDRAAWSTIKERKGFRMPPAGYKMKDLTLVAFQLADGLRRDGWYLRQTVIWKKPAAVEPMRLDRPATSHEYLFLFSKSEMYRAHNPGHKWWGHSVWEIGSDSDGSHPAAMPSELPERCILATTEHSHIVFDPFLGSGTVAASAQKLDRSWIGCELNEKYEPLQRDRLRQPGLQLEVA
ncbi:DNA-methyltransferase [Paraburkholderia antibiotica]|nr:site-specific DNA-methyltransferase [Paraburkholderia antibiotica]